MVQQSWVLMASSRHPAVTNYFNLVGFWPAMKSIISNEKIFSVSAATVTHMCTATARQRTLESIKGLVAYVGEPIYASAYEHKEIAGNELAKEVFAEEAKLAVNQVLEKEVNQTLRPD